MGGRIKTEAVSSKKEEWLRLEWQSLEQNARRLQVRIVKATQAGRWRKVKALQRLLTRSFAARVLAVKRVTENRQGFCVGTPGPSLGLRKA